MEVNVNEDLIDESQATVDREQLLNDLKAIARDAEELLRASGGEITAKAKEAQGRLAITLERAKATCQRMQDQTIAAAKAAAKKADMVIRDHPYESIGVAFGVGLLIGVLVTRK